MPPQTTMTLYQGVVLECQRCYAICRFPDAATRCHCPFCGLDIANWEELSAVVQAKTRPKFPWQNRRRVK